MAAVQPRAQGRMNAAQLVRQSVTQHHTKDLGSAAHQLARIDSLEIGTLKVRNIPCLVKSPPLRDIPTRETESLSPLALGFSMTIDYKTHKLTFGRHLPVEPSSIASKICGAPGMAASHFSLRTAKAKNTKRPSY